MEATDLINKLRQIEEHAREALVDMTPGTPKERVRLIMAIAAHLALKLEIHQPRGDYAAASNDESSDASLRA